MQINANPVENQKEDLIYRSDDGKFLASAIQLDDFLVKVNLEGRLNHEHSLQLTGYLTRLIEGGMSGRKFRYAVVDVKNLSAIDYKAKKELQTAISHYYDHGKLNYIAVVSPNFLLFSLGAYINRIRRQSPISFHRTEESALKTVFQQRHATQEENVERDVDQLFGDDVWFRGGEHYLDGRRLTVETYDSWNFVDAESDFRSRVALVDGRVVAVKITGLLEEARLLSLVETLRQVRVYLGGKEAGLIVDLSELKQVQPAAKRLFYKNENEWREGWGRPLVVPPKRRQRLNRLFKWFKPIKKYLTVADNLTQGLRSALNADLNVLNSPDSIEGNGQALQSLSKKELINLVRQLRNENREIKESQKKRIDQLFETISKISWDDDFVPSPIVIENEDDAFFDLFHAVSLLQQDVYNMLEELKELNKDLEEKVNKRTREIAGKEANLSSLIENTKDLICSVDKNYNLLVSNSAYKQFIRETYNEDIQPGDNILEGLDPDIVNYWKPFYDRALSGETFEIVESRLLNSRKAFFEILFNPIRDEMDEVSGFSVFIKEITQQKEAEETIRRSQQLLASINHNIKEGIYRSNESKKIIYVNPAFVEMFGFSSEKEVYAASFADLYADEADRQTLIGQIKSDGRITNKEVKFKRKDGSYFWGLITSIRVVDEKGNEYYDGAIRDITPIKQSEDKLKEQNEELKKVNRELDRFVYSASHDLRAPLLSILGLIGIAKLEKTEDAKNRCLEMMEKSIKKLDNFIQDIINYSRNKRLLINKEKIDFEKLVDEIFHDLQFLKKSQQIRKIVSVRLHREFYSDLRRLKIVFYNLISNAIIYSTAIRDSFVEVIVEERGENVRISVNDNGQGIPEIHLDKVFNMFYRASEEEAGSGLGLYIVKETIEALQGAVEVKSQVGKGTSFIIELPSLER